MPSSASGIRNVGLYGLCGMNLEGRKYVFVTAACVATPADDDGGRASTMRTSYSWRALPFRLLQMRQCEWPRQSGTYLCAR